MEGRVDQQLDPEFQDDKKVHSNKEHLFTVLDIVLFLAKQEIPLRGNDESSNSLNRGNFLELFDFISKYDENVAKRLNKLPENAKMMHHDIQNDLLQAAVLELLDIVKTEVLSAGKYAILADEVKDASKKELLGVALRYFHVDSIKEVSIGFIELSSLKAEDITKQLLSILQPLQLDKKECVGQSYDGASVMSGCSGGVQALMKKAGYINATYYHCASHKLNLVLGQASTVSPDIKSFFVILDMMYSFFTGVKRHSRFMEMQKEMYQSFQQLELVHSCETQLSSRFSQVDHFLRRLDCVLNTLASFEEDDDSETRMSALSLLKAANNKKFLILLVFFNSLFQQTECCTKSLQKKTLDISQSICLIDILKEELANFNTKKIFDFANELSIKYEIDKFDSSKTRRQVKLPASLKSSYVMCSVGQNKVTNEHDLLTVLKQVIGNLSGELNARFGGDQQNVMRLCTAFLTNKVDHQQVESFSKPYGISVPQSNLYTFKKCVEKSAMKDITLIEIFDIADPEVFPGLHQVLQILITIPQTSVTVERLFSSVKRIKTRLRSKMNTVRLTGLTLLSFEKEMSQKIG